MNRLSLTPAARADLDGIWGYTAKRWNLEQAEIYVRHLAQVMNTLAASPNLGRRIDDIRPGYLKFPVASHVVFYRQTTSGIEVTRILHKSMDVERHM